MQDFLIVGILLPFETEWHKLSNTPHSAQKASSNHVDAVALMAWLIVHPLVEQWLEKLNTPMPSVDRSAALDNTDFGMRHSIDSIGDQLISIADSIKSEIDAYILFSPSRIEEDGAAFVSAIDPSRGSFRGATKLLSLRTTQINLFDTLKTNVNRVRVLRKGH